MTTMLLALLLLQDAPARSAPFSGVRWENEIPVVLVDGDWAPLLSLDGIPAARIVGFCKSEYGDLWKKRFVEDLVDVLKKLGHAPKATVELELSKGGTPVKRAAAMTEAKRREASRAPRENKPPYEFESAKIVFRYSGAFEGEETFWAAGQGSTLVLQRAKKVGEWDRRTTFVKDGKATTWDPATRTYFTSPVRPADIDLSVGRATDAGLKLAGLLRKGEEAVAGRTCALYETSDGLWRSWRWKGIELKIEMKKPGLPAYVKEAVSVDEGLEIPSELLKIPDGYTAP